MNGWPVKPLGDICKFERGLTYTKADEVDLSRNAVLRANNINLGDKALDLSEIRYISENVDVPARKKVRRGSLLICTASGSRSHLGKVALIDDDYDYAFGGFMGLITPTDQIGSRYLYYALTGSEYQAKLDSLADGANINNLKFKDIADLPIPVPPLEEQRRIVAVLDEAFAAIATATANAEKNLTNVRELFEAIFRQRFDHAGGGWKSYSLPEICENLDSKRRPITKSDREPGEIPYYGASGQVDSVRDNLFDDDLLLISEDGANLLMRTYPIAFSISGKSWVNNHAHILRFSDMDTQSLVEYYFNSISVAPWVTGMAQPKLNQKSLNEIPVPLPPAVDRARIVVELDILTHELERLEQLYGANLAQLSALKQSLLNRAFAGELRLREGSAEIASNDNFATPEFAAKIVAFAYERHVAKNRIRNFGTVKAEKILHMVEAIGGIDLGRRPMREAAGPDDAKHRHATWDWARSHKFFRFNKRSGGGGHDFEKLRAYSFMVADAKRAVALADPRVANAIELLVDMDRDFAELVTTTHAAWNNLILDRCTITDDAIVRAARDDWHRDKLRFDPSRFHDAIRFIRKNNVVPNGSAKSVGGQEQLAL